MIRLARVACAVGTWPLFVADYLLEIQRAWVDE